MTPRFDLYAFSLFVHSSIFVLSLLALGSWLLVERWQRAALSPGSSASASGPGGIPVGHELPGTGPHA